MVEVVIDPLGCGCDTSIAYCIPLAASYDVNQYTGLNLAIFYVKKSKRRKILIHSG